MNTQISTTKSILVSGLTDFVSALVIEGELWFVKTNQVQSVWRKLGIDNVPDELLFIRPVIISRSEPILDGDWILINGNLQQTGRDGIRNWKEMLKEYDKVYKVLVLDDYLAEDRLRAIVNTMIKNHDKVVVECSSKKVTGAVKRDTTFEYIIKLDENKKAILHPAVDRKKTYTRDEVLKITELAWATASAYGSDTNHADFMSWFNENV